MLELISWPEFNQDGRTFAPGDDKYWTAVDLHYWWVSPACVHANGSNADFTGKPTTSVRFARTFDRGAVLTMFQSGMILRPSQRRM